MAFFNKRMILLFTNLFLLAGIGTTIANYSTSVIQGVANQEERSTKFSLLTSWSGTLPTSSTYVTLNATSNICGFVLSGKANKFDANSVFGINTPGSSNAANSNLLITKPSYIISFTGIVFEAYSSSPTARYFKINGVTDTVNGVTSSYNFASPLTTSKLTATGDSILIESTVGALAIKSITLYYY